MASSVDYVALQYAMAALGDSSGGGGEPQHASQWYVSTDPAGTLYPGAVNGDLILYDGGDVYKVIDGTPVDQKVNIGSKDAMNPYTYAKSIGYQGTKTEFDIKFLSLLNSGSTNTIISGGVPQVKPNPDVIISGGVPQEKPEYDTIIDGNTIHTEDMHKKEKTFTQEQYNSELKKKYKNNSKSRYKK